MAKTGVSLYFCNMSKRKRNYRAKHVGGVGRTFATINAPKQRATTKKKDEAAFEELVSDPVKFILYTVAVILSFAAVKWLLF